MKVVEKTSIIIDFGGIDERLLRIDYLAGALAKEKFQWLPRLTKC